MVGDIFQPTHLLFVLVVALLVLGPKRLPEVGRTLGSGIRDFRQALSGESHDRSQQSDSSEAELSAQWDPAEDQTRWSEETVGTSSFDEPAVAAPADAQARTDTASSDIGATPDEDLSSSEHELAHQTELAHQSAESGGAAEQQTESRD